MTVIGAQKQMWARTSDGTVPMMSVSDSSLYRISSAFGSPVGCGDAPMWVVRRGDMATDCWMMHVNGDDYYPIRFRMSVADTDEDGINVGEQNYDNDVLINGGLRDNGFNGACMLWMYSSSSRFLLEYRKTMMSVKSYIIGPLHSNKLLALLSGAIIKSGVLNEKMDNGVRLCDAGLGSITELNDYDHVWLRFFVTLGLGFIDNMRRITGLVAHMMTRDNPSVPFRVQWEDEYGDDPTLALFTPDAPVIPMLEKNHENHSVTVWVI